jgi:hypothetical protein
MKKLVFAGVAVLCASVAFGAVTDNAPGVPEATRAAEPVGYNPAFGSLIRSWSTSPVMAGGIACFADNYVVVGDWTASRFASYGWRVYTTTGSYVRSVRVTTTANGCRGGSAKCHRGSGYFVDIQESGGTFLYPYSTGGNPGGTGTSLGVSARGRGIAWDGTYYYATLGGYGTQIGIFASTGSQVGTVPGTVHTLGIYDYSVRGSYLYVGTQTGGALTREIYLTNGSTIRSFSTASWTAGIDDGANDPYLYCYHQTNYQVRVYDGPSAPAVLPTSIGKIKTLYR